MVAEPAMAPDERATVVNVEDLKRELLRSLAERAKAASVSDPDPDPDITAPDFRVASREDVARELWLRYGVR